MLETEGPALLHTTIIGCKTGGWIGHAIFIPQIEQLRPVTSGNATGRLRFARGCTYAAAIVEDLWAARLRLGPRGRSSIDAGGKGHHGGLIFAVALAVVASCVEAGMRWQITVGILRERRTVRRSGVLPICTVPAELAGHRSI